MAVLSATKRLVKDGQSSGNNSHKFQWKVKCDDATDTTFTVYANAVTPKKGSAPPSECGSLPAGYVALDDGDVQPMGESPFWFIITAEYGLPAITGLDNPLTVVQKWGGGSDLFAEAYEDLDGAIFKNAAGVALDPKPLIPVNAGSFGVTIRTTNLLLYTGISHRVNSAAIWGLPARTVKIGRVSWRQASESGVKFWEVDIPFDYNPDTWELKFLNVGYEQLVSGELESIRIRDDATPSLPEPLDENGAWAPGTVPIEYKRRLYYEINFAALNLPNPFTLT